MKVIDIVRSGYEAFRQTHNLPRPVLRAAERILACRTPKLGGHVQECPNGDFERPWYHSCKHRFCPQCGYTAVERWLVKQKARLLKGDHFHAIFTIPAALDPLWRTNVGEMTRLFFQCVRETLFELLGDPRHLGATVGVIAALHTWGQTLILHPHLHCLVTGGGLNALGEWVAVTNGYLLPFRVVRMVFARKMIEALRAGLRDKSLRVPEGQSAERWERVLTKLGKKKWHVKIMERYPHGQGVATYLARYLRGGPIRDTRILGFDGETVRFRYTDNRASKKAGAPVRDVMELSVEEFLTRLFQHLPEPRTIVVRHWGLYSPSKSKDLETCRELLGQPPREAVEDPDWQTCCEAAGSDHPERCPLCGARLRKGPSIPPDRPCRIPRSRIPRLWKLPQKLAA